MREEKLCYMREKAGVQEAVRQEEGMQEAVRQEAGMQETAKGLLQEIVI